MKINLYKLNSEYINNLYDIDKQILFNKEKRPYIGIFLIIDRYGEDIKFFVPLSSSIRNFNSKYCFKIINSKGEFISCLRFDKMIPVSDYNYEMINISEVMTVDRKYANLLLMELFHIRKFENIINELFYKISNDLLNKRRPYYLKKTGVRLYKHIENIKKGYY